MATMANHSIEVTNETTKERKSFLVDRFDVLKALVLNTIGISTKDLREVAINLLSYNLDKIEVNGDVLCFRLY